MLNVTEFSAWYGLKAFQVVICGDMSMVVGPVEDAPNLDDYDDGDDFLEALSLWALRPV